VSLTFHDMFCGAGGSTEGARMAGAIPLIGMNHWPVACESYDTNHAQHGARAACVDVVTQDPRRYPRADLLLASPECTHHSYARGKQKDDPGLFDPEGDMGAERSRATMWDVVRFAEAHEYKAVIVENVGAAVKWGLPRGRKLKHGDYGPLFVAWLQAMEALDYRWRVVHLNSMVCGVPQSRDRLYVVFWKKWQRTPDLDITALGWCPRCDELVNGRQTCTATSVTRSRRSGTPSPPRPRRSSCAAFSRASTR
jgi:DNA (cytosine-5)-methyltransferase 1